MLKIIILYRWFFPRQNYHILLSMIFLWQKLSYLIEPNPNQLSANTAVQDYPLQEDSLILEEVVANFFLLQNVFSQKTEWFRFLLGCALCPTWPGTVSILAWQCVQPGLAVCPAWPGTVSSLAWHCVQPEKQFIQPQDRRKCVALGWPNCFSGWTECQARLDAVHSQVKTRTVPGFY